MSPAPQPDEISELGPAVADFFDLWLAKQQPQAALQKHWSPRAADERLVPAEAYSVPEYRKRIATKAAAAMPADRNGVVNKTADVLADWGSGTKPLTAAGAIDVLAPIGPTDDPELWQALREEKLTPTPLAGTRALAYRVRHADDYRWAAAATVGYATIIPERIKEGLDVQGVIARIRAGKSSWIILMFWVDEAPGAPQQWRLWGLTPVPTA